MSGVGLYRRPVVFYGLSIAIPWAFWFAAAYLSHLPVADSTTELLTGVLGLAGLIAPVAVAAALILPEADLRQDVWKRLRSVSAVRPIYLWLTGLVMLISILAAQAISLLFGHSVDQFRLSDGASFSAGLFPAWFFLLVAPVLEELAWHSYGTDCLRPKFSIFTLSMGFAVFWALWHRRCHSSKATIRATLVETGWIYSLNFSLSLFPYVLLMNWLYFKSNRNILVAIVFHLTAGVFNELFATHPDSKVIQTGLLIALCIFVIMQDRTFFFSRDTRSVVGTET